MSDTIIPSTSKVWIATTRDGKYSRFYKTLGSWRRFGTRAGYPILYQVELKWNLHSEEQL